MEIEQFEQWLHDKLGFSSEIIGSRAVEFAVRQRLDALSMDDPGAYFKIITSQSDEWQRLVNLITIPETWFFRDEKPFSFLAGFGQKFHEENVDGRVLRILSVPCSSGEEPYSIVMTLLDQGLAPGSFSVHAVDVNTTVLNRAQQGVYRETALRAIDEARRNRFFERRDDGYLIREQVRQLVRFKQGNILHLSKESSVYDIIFCRNLLIYLSDQKKQELLRNLEMCLSPDGILILGHAELSQAVLTHFAPVGVPGSFAVHRRVSVDGRGAQLPIRALNMDLLTPPTPSPKPSGRPSNHPDTRDKRVAKLQSEEIERLVTKIEKLADGGQLDEAAQSCVPFVDASVDDPDLYYVCGLVYEAVGRQAQAIELLRRAVELQPEHYRALILLAAALESQGEIDEALKLRCAAEEIAERG